MGGGEKSICDRTGAACLSIGRCLGSRGEGGGRGGGGGEGGGGERGGGMGGGGVTIQCESSHPVHAVVCESTLDPNIRSPNSHSEQGQDFRMIKKRGRWGWGVEVVVQVTVKYQNVVHLYITAR